MVFADIQSQYGNEIVGQTRGFKTRTYSPLELYTRWAPTLTVVFRTIVFESDCLKTLSWIKRQVFGDLTMYMACSTIGKIYGMSDVVGNYRRLPTGASQYLSKHPYHHFMNRIAISKYLGKDFMAIDKRRFSSYFLYCIKRMFIGFPENLYFLCRLFWFAPWECIKECLNVPIRKWRKIFRR